MTNEYPLFAVFMRPDSPECWEHSALIRPDSSEYREHSVVIRPDSPEYREHSLVIRPNSSECMWTLAYSADFSGTPSPPPPPPLPPAASRPSSSTTLRSRSATSCEGQTSPRHRMKRESQ